MNIFLCNLPLKYQLVLTIDWNNEIRSMVSEFGNS
jgi:hypothetical protein